MINKKKLLMVKMLNWHQKATLEDKTDTEDVVEVEVMVVVAVAKTIVPKTTTAKTNKKLLSKQAVTDNNNVPLDQPAELLVAVDADVVVDVVVADVDAVEDHKMVMLQVHQKSLKIKKNFFSRHTYVTHIYPLLFRR